MGPDLIVDSDAPHFVGPEKGEEGFCGKVGIEERVACRQAGRVGGEVLKLMHVSLQASPVREL